MTYNPEQLMGGPQHVFVSHDEMHMIPAHQAGTRWRTPAADLSIVHSADELSISIRCPREPLGRVMLRWNAKFSESTLFLGDAWERGYGDMQWRHLQAERIMPWYFTAHHPETNSAFCAGVKTQPNSLCFWTVDAEGICLWLDLRNGGSPSIPGDRTIKLASVVALESSPNESLTKTIKRFCGTMCAAPRRAPANICGSNNWYYAYGSNFDANQVRRDATLLAELAAGHANRPYCVIDAGWSVVCGPWVGLPKKFPDMPGLADDIRKIGVRPGIWMRPTALGTVDNIGRLRSGPQNSFEKALDLTLPENLELIRSDVARITSWGYELIKHDFSCWDMFARWGFDFGAQMTDAGWHFSDRSLTNAEIILNLYRTIRAAAGDAVLIGCNTFGHLGAGMFEVQRVGDDTSGREWERTRKMGVNTLAFRLPQQNTFFQCDVDCVAHTAATPWEKDRQFLELVASSGTPLFVSVDPTLIEPHVKSAMHDAMQLALSGGAGEIEPLDWLTNTCPARWRVAGREVSYNWIEPN